MDVVEYDVPGRMLNFFVITIAKKAAKNHMKLEHGFLKSAADSITNSHHAACNYQYNVYVLGDHLESARACLWDDTPLRSKFELFVRLEVVFRALKGEVSRIAALSCPKELTRALPGSNRRGVYNLLPDPARLLHSGGSAPDQADVITIDGFHLFHYISCRSFTTQGYSMQDL